MAADASLAARAQAAVNPDRLLQTALRLCSVYSPTCEAGEAAEALAGLLHEEGFPVERPVADWPAAPAVVARLHSGRAGRTLQFDGHLDTVHLPFVPPRVEGGLLSGTGTADMKGGISAAVEAMRALRDADALPAGAILLTAHDHHEGPWGDSRQLHALIDGGYVGDGALVPEYLCDRLPLIGRGMAILRVHVRRAGEPVHEVFRPAGLPDVIAAGAEVVRRLKRLDADLALRPHPLAGPASAFAGRIESGEIYNQAPVECRIEGTRRWLPGEPTAQVEEELREMLRQVAESTGTEIELEFILQRDAFALRGDDPLVTAFQGAFAAIQGRPLGYGAKPFVDDGNTLTARGGIPAITHGPDARGAHTLEERVPVAELVRVARTYALTALNFCGPELE
jgi:acetylornithine deacetylase/succinyl-diaminopimelate desuccinylase-like protein